MRSKKLSLVVVPVLLAACSNSGRLQQDIYNSQYYCSQDWDQNLCEPYNSTSSYRTASSNYQIFYIGPQYYSNNRKVKYLGRTLTAQGTRHINQPVMSQHVFKDAKSKPIRRGGFGRATGGTSFGG
ncbi:hypothetical protein [Acinetobacter sp. B51(2017)]|uniref:hypothetical protein n=1 Tax=Acinetobacter sp. B51(2017) TaxID=2060938 RepID=UPI000F082E40|nr:hypothetical protein [Acinetobacter sp. B51(2017)]